MRYLGWDSRTLQGGPNSEEQLITNAEVRNGLSKLPEVAQERSGQIIMDAGEVVNNTGDNMVVVAPVAGIFGPEAIPIAAAVGEATAVSGTVMKVAGDYMKDGEINETQLDIVFDMFGILGGVAGEKAVKSVYRGLNSPMNESNQNIVTTITGSVLTVMLNSIKDGIRKNQNTDFEDFPVLESAPDLSREYE